ncbi:phosphoglycerate dehydrogenase-like enzyme [Arcanobacterium wilhelmae]|uniref:Phosphoglycerate dehydrogenase-like enzyme n=1 Tax=Arcanobacterium wilhelmae TaxID=1803177 RepID=A0ABT9NBG7_9ACTO|nr:NAD(P)-dependent oxidoreductase [Arcanobacterium wilhelmae]MDP9801057.1 phosphoglycerate dehydrogenase-like enzyme [Arcanobacterium wilhelmae]WFN90413.1 NAD(P)-dependent oxidoreductase [Arcanobacterium wilhelmae]
MSEVNVAIDPFWDVNIDIPGVNVVRWDLEGEAPGPLDIVVTGHWVPGDGAERAAKAGAKLLQIGSIGFDAVNPDLPEGLQVANAATVHETATAEMVLAMLLAGLRNIPQMVADNKEHKWNTFYYEGLADKKVMLIGVGGVGREIMKRLEPFAVDLTLVASRERDEDFGHVYSLDQIDDLLPEQDVVIIVIPATDATKGLVNKDFLAAMKDGATFLNAGRGTLAVTEDLAAEGDRLHLLIDVVDPEPLPADSPLWEAAQLITSHNGGNTKAMHPRMQALIERQAKHALAGEPFENVVLGK